MQGIVIIAWVIAVIAGIILTVIGIGRAGNVVCNCPMQMEGQPSTCHCDRAEVSSGFMLAYAGVGAALAGVVAAIVDFSRQV